MVKVTAFAVVNITPVAVVNVTAVAVNNDAKVAFFNGAVFSSTSVAAAANTFCLFGLMLYVHGKQLRSCRDGQLSYPHCSWASLSCHCCCNCIY